LNPRVSVLLPVYNCPAYVGAAIESILNQTFEDFELLIIDDGSTDDTPQVLSRYNDIRIRHIRQENRGLVDTLNLGISLSQGQYIARQDADDISYPSRFEKQVAFFESHPECNLLGTWAQIYEGEKPSERFHRHPIEDGEIKYNLLFNNPFVHSSVMFRKSVFLQVESYTTDPAFKLVEDYELWSRISRIGMVANLPEVLVNYREVSGSLSRVNQYEFKKCLVNISANNIQLESCGKPEESNYLNIAAITHSVFDLVSKPEFNMMKKTLEAIAGKLFFGHIPPRIQSDIDSRIFHLSSLYFLSKKAPRFLFKIKPLRLIAKKIWNIYKQGFNRLFLK
jgi:glycosyltransferase involved in cell wall biosynthesis